MMPVSITQTFAIASTFLSLFRSLSLSLYHPLSLTLSLSLSIYHPLSLSLSLSLSLILSFSFSLSHYIILSLSLLYYILLNSVVLKKLLCPKITPTMIADRLCTRTNSSVRRIIRCGVTV